MIYGQGLPDGYTIFCDDIREEVTGKSTLVGVYHDVMRFSSRPPARILQLAYMITYREDAQGPVRSIVFKIFHEDDKGETVLSETKADFPEPPDDPTGILRDKHSVLYKQMIMAGRFQNVEISGNCRIKVRAYVGEDEVRLGTLGIVFEEEPS